jgi:hypothetical protein
MKKLLMLFVVFGLSACEVAEDADIAKESQLEQADMEEEMDIMMIDTESNDLPVSFVYAECDESIELTATEDGVVHYRSCLIGRVEKTGRDNCSFCEGDCSDHCVCPATSTRSHVSVNNGEGICSENIQCQGPSDCKEGGLCMVSYFNCGTHVTGAYCSTKNDDCRSELDCCRAFGESLDGCGRLCLFDTSAHKWTCSGSLTCE